MRSIGACVLVFGVVSGMGGGGRALAQAWPEPVPDPVPGAEPAEPGPAAPVEAEPPPSEPPAATEPTPAEQSFDDQPVGDAAPAADLDPERTPEDIQSFADATLERGRIRFALNVFGDASLGGARPASGDGTSSFSLGTLALLLNADLGASLIGTGEVAFDANRDNVQATKLERLHLRWQNERGFVVGGRMHADLGYWNTAYHHGAWLHLPISRPRAVRGEGSGGILPIHWVGVEGGVFVPLEPATLTLAAGLGNGRGHDERDVRLTTDSNDFKAIKGKVELRGLGLPDLRFGIGGLYDHIAAEPAELRPALPDQEITEVIGNGYLAYRGVALTLIAEGYAIWHMGDDDTFTTSDVFVVAGWRMDRVTPYVQLERVGQHGEVDPFYTPVPDMPTPSSPVDQTEVLFGVRVDPSVWSAIKAEYAGRKRDGKDGLDHSVTVNWSFGI